MENFRKRGIKPKEIDVKLFGGSNILGTSFDGGTVGEKNIETAMKLIKSYGLRIMAKNVGGVRGRRLYFFSDTGEVYLKHTPKRQPDFH